MIKQKLNKIIMTLLFFITITNNIFASTISEKLGDYNIYYYDDPISYVTYGVTRQKNYEYYYIDENGNEETVYCLNLGLPGAEEYNGYSVSATEAISDLKISSIIANAYPYKSLEELGLETISEARFASQFAIWTYTSNLDLSRLKPNEEKYQRVINAINNIYSTGINSNYSANVPVEIYESRSNASINSNYYSKDFVISSNSNVKNITLKSSNNSVKITDENGNEVSDLAGLNSFKVLVPISSVQKDTSIDLKFETKLKENISLFGATKIANMQNVAITFAPIYVKDVDVSFNIKKQDSKIQIIKIDADDENLKLEGAKFKITDAKTGKDYGIFITDKNGVILADMLDLGINEETKVIIEEIEAPNGYYVDYDNNKTELELKFGKINAVTLKNKKATGKIKIIKRSLNDNELNNISKDTPLEGAKFEIYDLNGNKLEEVITDENGVATSSNLVIGKYKIKEIEAPKYYKINDKEVEVQIQRNGEEIIITVKDDNISVPKRLPNTGF